MRRFLCVLLLGAVGACSSSDPVPGCEGESSPCGPNASCPNAFVCNPCGLCIIHHTSDAGVGDAP